MPHIWYEAIAVSASASGDVTAYSTGVFTGFVQAVSHEASATTGISTAAVLSIAGEKGLSIFTSTAGSTAWTLYPRRLPDTQSCCSTSTGSSAAYSWQFIPLADERIVISVSSNASTGGCAEVVKVWIGG